MEIEVKILDDRLLGWGFPARGSEFAIGLDLFACLSEPVLVKPYEPAQLISSGFAISIRDPNYCALILPRSGLSHLKGLILGNTVGVIDPDYTGPCMISVWNRNLRMPPSTTDSEDIIIRPGDKIAQLILVEVARPTWKVVENLCVTERGSQGFGSSG